VIVLAWQDRRETIISAYHSAEVNTISKDGTETIKANMALDYYNNMGGVNLKDKMLQSYLLEQKTETSGISNFSKDF
jgi:hypothetical protein